jgi:very-short-patch-repair endonuclease
MEEKQVAKDAGRTNFLNEKGLTVIRIENKNVFINTGAVLDYILQHLK